MAKTTRDPILEGLTLPPGFRLTVPRKNVLAAFGEALLAGSNITTYRPKAPSYRNCHGWVRGSRDTWGRAEMQAFRMMYKAGWVQAPVTQQQGSYYGSAHLTLKDPLPTLARRLCAVKALHSATLEKAEDKGAYEAELNAIEDTRGAWRSLSYANMKDLQRTGEAGVIDLYRKTVAAFAAHEAAEARFQARKEAATLLPLPPIDEALAWLVVKEMSKH